MVALLCFFLITALVSFIQGDRILVHEPIKGGRFKPGSVMNIDYTVRFEGMAKLASASVSILYPNHTVVTFLPEANWIDSPTGKRGASASWTIPSDLSEGKYKLRISGPAMYLCSKTGDGKAPYTRCKMSMHRTRNIIVDMEGEDGMDPEAVNNQGDQDNVDQGDVTGDDDQSGMEIDINQDNENTDGDLGDVTTNDNQADVTTDDNQDGVTLEDTQDDQIITGTS